MTHQTNQLPGSASFAEQLREFVRVNMNWFLAAALALLLMQDVFGAHGLIAMRRSMREASQAQKEITLMNEENLRLEGRVKSLKTDPSAVERIAREQMGLARPGEYIFKVQPRATDAEAPSSIARPGAPAQTPSPVPAP